MYIVTGVSRGLGRAMCDLLLSKGEKVIGIGRTNTINHSNYSFYPCDLSSPGAVDKLNIEMENGPITLVNNAGILGTIGRITDQTPLVLEEVLRVNTIAPMELTRLIYSQVVDKNTFRLVNISSGAANRAIPSWGAYCASKSALNMLSETFYLEEKEKGWSPNVYVVSPGVIDTEMQVQIRSANKDDFSSLEKFIELKTQGQLFSPQEAAQRLFNLLEQPYSGELFFDLRSVN